MNQSEINVQWMRLMSKAFKVMPGSIRQKKIQEEIKQFEQQHGKPVFKGESNG